MKILNIQFKTPDTSSLMVVTLLGVIAVSIAAGLVYSGIAAADFALVLASGMVGGALASAYGVSVRDYGLRGAILSSVFSLGFMSLVYAMMTWV